MSVLPLTRSRRKFSAACALGFVAVAFGLLTLTMLGNTAPVQAAAFVRPSQHIGQLAASEAMSHTLMLPFIANNNCAFNLKYARNRFGVQIYGRHGQDSPYFCELVDSGATWLRNEITWDSAEPVDASPIVYQWNYIDSVLTPARQSGYNMIATINGNPDWAATHPRGPIDKAPLHRFATFTAALVERYDGDGIDDAPGSPIVEYWEFYNEPDAGNLGWDKRWGNYGKEYAEMLAAVYPAMKIASPKAKVLLGGIAYDWFEEADGPFVRRFLDDVLANGGGNFFDVMNFHQYPPFAVNWGSPNGPGLLEKTNAMRAKLAEYDYNKPFVISESGAHSNDAVSQPMTPELQARYVTMLYTQVIAADVDIMIWFMLYDPVASYPYMNGLVTAVAGNERPTRKAAFTAYRTAVDLLSEVNFDRALTAAETGNAELLAYAFTNKVGAPFYVAWFGPITRTDTAPLRVPGATATLHDIYGTTQQVTDQSDGASDGIITLQVGAQPVYIYPQP
jgi:hypothetical protein